MSNLPPGVTDAMIPGNGPGELEELDQNDYVGEEPGTWTCEVCNDATVGWYEQAHAVYDYDVVVWAPTWLTPDEKLACADCVAAIEEQEKKLDAEFEAYCATLDD